MDELFAVTVRLKLELYSASAVIGVGSAKLMVPLCDCEPPVNVVSQPNVDVALSGIPSPSASVVSPEIVGWQPTVWKRGRWVTLPARICVRPDARRRATRANPNPRYGSELVNEKIFASTSITASASKEACSPVLRDLKLVCSGEVLLPHPASENTAAAALSTATPA